MQRPHFAVLGNAPRHVRVRKGSRRGSSPAPVPACADYLPAAVAAVGTRPSMQHGTRHLSAALPAELQFRSTASGSWVANWTAVPPPQQALLVAATRSLGPPDEPTSGDSATDPATSHTAQLSPAGLHVTARPCPDGALAQIPLCGCSGKAAARQLQAPLRRWVSGAARAATAVRHKACALQPSVHAWQFNSHRQRVIVKTSVYGRPPVTAGHRCAGVNSLLIICKGADSHSQCPSHKTAAAMAAPQMCSCTATRCRELCTLPSDLVLCPVKLQLQTRHSHVDSVPCTALLPQLPVRVVQHL